MTLLFGRPWAWFGAVLAIAVGAGDSFGQTGEPWQEFRGTASRGYVAEGELPNSWSDDDYAWRRELGAYEVGSVAIYGGQVFYLTSRRPDTISLASISLESGQPLWSKEFPQPPYHLHTRNTYAASTPAVDQDRVFVARASPEHTYLECFDHQGNQIWSRDFGRWVSQHGFGTSPRLFGSLVLLFNSQQAEQTRPGEPPGTSHIIAVDRDSGETVWESELTATRTCYGVPAIYQPPGGPAQVIGANTGDGLFGLDARSGKMLWRNPVFDMRCCSTPMIAGDVAIGSAGSGGGGNHLVAVRIPKADEQPQELYRIDSGNRAPYVPTPVIKDGLMYLVSDKSATASCVDAESGEVIWSNRVGGNVGASPIIVGETLLIVDLDGQATLLRAGREYEKLGEVDLGGPVGATPAFSQGRLLLRVGNELRCLVQPAI